MDALAEGLAKFKGGVLMVSHDQHLISASVDELWMVTPERTIVPFHGTFDDYKEKLRRAGAAPAGGGGGGGSAAAEH